VSVHDKYVHKVIIVMYVIIIPVHTLSYSLRNKYLQYKLYCGIINHHFSFSTSRYFQYTSSGRTVNK